MPSIVSKKCKESTSWSRFRFFASIPYGIHCEIIRAFKRCSRSTKTSERVRYHPPFQELLRTEGVRVGKVAVWAQPRRLGVLGLTTSYRLMTVA